MRNNLDRLGRLLRRDGLERREFVLMAYASIWLEPEWSYHEILEAYADYVNDVPERVHASLCCHLLAVGMETGPEQYFKELKMEVESENGISFKQGSGASAIGTDPGESAGHARSTGNGLKNR